MITATETARQQRLDPDQNFSTAVLKERGHYRRQYLATATNQIWGTEAGTCGVRTLWRHEDGQYRIMPALCARWSCLLCGPMRAAWLKRQLREAQERYALDYFWTLTIWTELMPARWSDQHITWAWNRLRTTLVRKFGPISYIWIREHTQAGYAHLHLVCDLPIEKMDLSALWKEASGGSYIVDVQPVETQYVADYLSKYCTQEATARALPGMEHLANKRLFSKSRDVRFEPFKAPGAKIEITDQETGEVRQVSPWRIGNRPYWTERKRLSREHGPPIRERIHGQPSATFSVNTP